MQFTLENLLTAVNAAGFTSQDELEAWVKAGRRLVSISTLTTQNAVLDATVQAARAASEQAKQANNAEIARLQAELAALVTR